MTLIDEMAQIVVRRDTTWNSETLMYPNLSFIIKCQSVQEHPRCGILPIRMVGIHQQQKYSLIPCESIIHKLRRVTDIRNRIKPGQLLVLAVYSYALVQGCKRDWISPSRLSKLGAAIVGVLSMGKSSTSHTG
jgi:hypothetical protein